MMPLWVWTVLWMLRKRQEQDSSLMDYQVREMALNDLTRSLPVPNGKFATWLTQQILMWTDRERERLLTLRRMGVSEVGILKP